MSPSCRKERLFLLIAAFIILAAGIGLRDPWPADEPRFVLIARDMVDSGNWLLPRVGGDLYPDKPPVFFWVTGLFYLLTGSIRWAFLLPGLFAGLGTLWLVTDLGRRLWNDRVGLWSGAILLAMVQFPLVMKSAHIDALLCLFTTLGLYGLLRHLLLGPDWRWYALGGFFCGVGVITKGVGFLPMLVLIPYAMAVTQGWMVWRSQGSGLRWLLAPAALLGAILVWLVPMLLATSQGGDYLAYRDNILFHQTVTRYVDANGHIAPPWYLLTHAVPWLWLPVTLLLPWLVPRWRLDLKNRDGRILLLLGWVALVLLFFCLSSGKRSLYIFPAAPAVALLAGVYAEELASKPRVRSVLTWLTGVLATVVTAASAYLLARPEQLAERVSSPTVFSQSAFALLACGVVMWAVIIFHGKRRALAAFAVSMSLLWLVVSLVVNPMIDRARSGAELMETIALQVPPSRQLGLTTWKEQQLLHWRRPVVHFGYRRDSLGASQDGAAWLSQGNGRVLLMARDSLGPCFDPGRVEFVASAHGREWVLASRAALTGLCPDWPERIVQYTAPGLARSKTSTD